MQKVKFIKMNGSGNDFILVDHRSNFLKDVSLPDFARIICRRQESVGANGLIFIENSETADFKWRFFNADGSEAEMCGNGGRCVARYAYLKGIAGSNLTFETLSGIIRAEVKNNRVRLQMPIPTELKLHQFIPVDEQNFRVSSINTGVPHVIVLVENIEQIPVKDLGRKIRFHPAFQPAGTNVNFVQIIDVSHLNIRTYERGVEDETLACGTGAVGSALVAAALGKTRSPVQAKTQGGEVLTIHFQKNSEVSFSQVYLEGDTCLVFEGTLGEDVWHQYENVINKDGDK
ncbi:MAG: diaminopimelate epimerase [Deltaproteobacteria bacterium]|nr:diaminopimelate epimerase [Deltaproteobacteria bacterium]